ncbi:MAG TPA: response regulator [Bryobacteraceae bacterium]|nr:response regulator [Bryobacteraceae bacterium]
MNPAGIRILIVDDEPSLVKMMTVYLERLGYAVTACGSTQEASRLVQSEPASFAVAVLDATMEGLSMEQLALQMLRVCPALRLLAASGYPVDMNALEAAAPGRVAFLHKPFTPEMLAASVRRMLAPEKETL